MAKRWKKSQPVETPDKDNPYNLDAIAKIKEEYDEDAEKCRNDHPDIFKYFDGIKNTIVSLSHHPAGIIIAPIDLYDRYSLILDKDGLPVLSLDMSAAHDVGLVKYDLLALDTCGVINETCKMAGIPYPHTWDINFDDQKVWADMKTSPAGCFQFVEPFAFDSLKKYDVKSIYDLSIVTAAIRPGGASYREKLFNHEFNHNPSKELDDLLAGSLGYCIFQEDTLKFLQQICGMSGGEADNIRRAIGHKDEKAIAEAMPKILEGYCAHSKRPREVAEQEAKAFLQIIKDSSSYQFGQRFRPLYLVTGIDQWDISVDPIWAIPRAVISNAVCNA